MARRVIVKIRATTLLKDYDDFKPMFFVKKSSLPPPPTHLLKALPVKVLDHLPNVPDIPLVPPLMLAAGSVGHTLKEKPALRWPSPSDSRGSEGTRSTICDAHECQYKTVYILVHTCIGICIYMSQ